MRALTGISVAACSGALAVAIGAFGAHALALEGRSKEIFQTGVAYHFYHTLALLMVSLVMAWRPSGGGYFRWASYCFAGGIVFFSGSLYLLAVADWRWLGPVTPLGGLLFIAGWLFVAVGSARIGRSSE